MTYNEVLENLKSSIIDKKKSDLFRPSIDTLKVNFGVSVTTTFLKGLSGLSGVKVKNRINYLLRENGYKKEAILKPIQTDKTLLYDCFVVEHDFKELALINEEKNGNNPQFKEYFKGCGELGFIDKKAMGKNVQILQSYKVNSEKVLVQIN